jgi:hypothetical protein
MNVSRRLIAHPVALTRFSYKYATQEQTLDLGKSLDP